MVEGLRHVLVEQQLVLGQHTVLRAAQKPHHTLGGQLACGTGGLSELSLQPAMWVDTGQGAHSCSPLWMLMQLGSYLWMRPCTWSGRAGGNSKELSRGSRCFWLMNLVRCSLVI